MAKLDRGRIDSLLSELSATLEKAAPITTKKRNNLDDSTFAFPKQRKMPLDSCGRVRNAMARFGQVKEVTDAERRTAYKKIIREANKCNIDSTGFKDKYSKRFG